MDCWLDGSPCIVLGSSSGVVQKSSLMVTLSNGTTDGHAHGNKSAKWKCMPRNEAGPRVQSSEQFVSFCRVGIAIGAMLAALTSMSEAQAAGQGNGLLSMPITLNTGVVLVQTNPAPTGQPSARQRLAVALPSMGRPPQARSWSRRFSRRSRPCRTPAPRMNARVAG